jgi:hypothetical membrane protein
MTSRAVAGLGLVAAGVVIFMGIITAEAFYPPSYTTFGNEISDLGATRPPDSVSFQPSSAIFNATMVVSGLLLLTAAFGLERTFGRRRVWISVALLGFGVLGVGVFPGNRAPHPLFALLSFTSGGWAAILSASVQAGPLRWVSRVLGATTLGWLVVGLFGESSVFFEELGAGGVERWVAYPSVLWMLAFGGYLLAGEDARVRVREAQVR